MLHKYSKVKPLHIKKTLYHFSQYLDHKGLKAHQVGMVKMEKKGLKDQKDKRDQREKKDLLDKTD
jgi:hypothetical protein